MTTDQNIERAHEQANDLDWWRRQHGPYLGKVLWYVYHGRDVQALHWLRDMVNETLSEATLGGH